MFSAILPFLSTVTVLILTIFCIEAGHNTSFLENYPIISIDTLRLRLSYEAKYGPTPAIHDVYRIHLKTFCFADSPPAFGGPLINSVCTVPSTYSKFEPIYQISAELLETKSNSTSGSIPFFAEAQQAFHEKYDKLLHIAFIMYILSAVFTGLGLFVGFFAFVLRVIGAAVPIFTGPASTCLLISSVIVTVVGHDVGRSLNKINAGAQASAGTGFLVLTWTAFALSFADSFGWYVSAKKRATGN